MSLKHGKRGKKQVMSENALPLGTIEIIIRCAGCSEEHFHSSDYTYFSQNMSDYDGVCCPKCDKPTQWVLIARAVLYTPKEQVS
jgi:hypothetical protein